MTPFLINEILLQILSGFIAFYLSVRWLLHTLKSLLSSQAFPLSVFYSWFFKQNQKF
jgi:hypothetical protein